MEKKYKIITTSIDYDVEEQDLNEVWLEEIKWEQELIDKKIEEIKSKLPQQIYFEVECELEDLEDVICDNISDETGWLVNSFDYKIIR